VNKVAICLAGLCVMGLVLGCGPGGPKLVPAEGVVTLAGTPLDGANVLVHYADNNVAQDVTHDGGKFALTYMGKPGAVAGSKLKVSVTKHEATYSVAGEKDSGAPASDDERRKKMEEMTKLMQKASEATMSGKKGAAPKNEIDFKYSNPASSGLDVTIPETGAKDLKIELK
jgi:hypothetical protein